MKEDLKELFDKTPFIAHVEVEAGEMVRLEYHTQGDRELARKFLKQKGVACKDGESIREKFALLCFGKNIRERFGIAVSDIFVVGSK